MPSKARLLAKSMIESPILSEITTNPTITPATITTAVNDVATGNFASIDLLPSTGNDVGDQAFVQSTNRLYIWSGSGWYNIALINTTPTWDSNGEPAATYVLSADSPQTATTITLAASDPEGFPITYSHVTGGSMDSIATVSQDSSVFTITPKTVAQAPDGGTGSITFRATDGINILPYVSSFTLNFISIIDDSKYTTLMIEATSTGDNNSVADASSSNHTPTLINPANAFLQGTFSPYRAGGYSLDFPLTGSPYVRLPHNSNIGNFGTNPFTVEFWFKPINADDQMYFLDIRDINTSTGFQISRRAGNTVRVRNGNTTLMTSTTNLTDLDTWYHVLVHRNSSNELKLFINGAQEGGTVSSHTDNYAAVSSGNWNIGRDYVGSNPVHGYMTDIRITHGEAITPSSGGPTERLEATSNTKFLYAGTPYIADTHSSTASSNHEIEVMNNGSINISLRTSPVSPYDHEEYDVADNGGSIQSTNSDDTSSGRTGLSFPDHADFDLAGSDWTIEYWGRLSNGGGTIHNVNFLSKGDNNAVRPYSINYRLDENYAGWEPRMFGSSNGSTQWQGYSGSAWTGWDQWTHIAFVRNGNTTTRYINGKAYGSGTGDVFDNNEVLYVGGGYASEQPHTYSDLRISKSAVYTSDFIPPTGPLSSSGSVLHLKGTDASIIDKSQGGNLELSGNVTGSTTQVKFAGSKSMYFPGSLGDQIIAISGENVNLSAADPFTWEAWCYFNSVSGVIHIMSSNDVGSPAPDRIAFELRNSKLSAMFGGSVVQSGSQVLSTGQWYHLAISRAVGSPYTTTRFFVNGNLDQTATAFQQAVAIGSFDKWYIGSPTTNNIGNGYHEFNGYMQDVRFTEGLTRYTANFTPPTAALKG